MNLKLKISIITLLLLAAAACLNTSCKSSYQKERQSIAQRPSDVSKDTPAPNMYELLRRQPGLFVRGSAQAPSIEIRGRRSIKMSNEPLFYVNGQNMGHDFSRIAHINPGDVARIKVVKDPGELVAYGIGAANGVIDVTLK